jgi:AcrR family transcriptional regulator
VPEPAKDKLVEASAKPNRMDRRRLETRAKLLKATLALVIKKGIEKTTMDDITETADLGRRTLYYHFDSKEDCVIAAAALAYGEFAQEADTSTSGDDDPAMAVAMTMQLVIRGLIAAPITARLVEYPRFLAAAIKGSISDFAYEDLERGVKEGRFEPVLDPALIDISILWTLVGFLIEVHEKGGDYEGTLVDYTRLYLIILGLGKSEASDLAAQAAAAAKQT